MTKRYGVVVIGRNEGDRLIRCLKSVAGNPTIYVDSGSSDSSVTQGEKYGAHVVKLDMTMPFCAARARNAGVERLLREYPDLEFVQFVDGDCEVVSGWMEAAQRELEADRGLAAVCGRRREINCNSSVYNLLCDIEWDTPVGDVHACGGDAMYRISPFQSVGRFDEEFIAGEEPELCYRLRRAGWGIKRIDREMTSHDADMYRFKQWWKRCQRSGYAYALGALEHGLGPERYKLKFCLSVLFWACALPLAVLLLALINFWVAVSGFILCYGYLATKIYSQSRKKHLNFSRRQTATYTGFLVLQKFPELLGILQCGWQHMQGRKMDIIEYK